MTSYGYRALASLLVAVTLTVSGCQALFPKEAGKELVHFTEQTPPEGERAPDVKLVGLDGQTRSLSDYIGEKPLVLQLGSHSCPVYRYRRFDMNALQRQYAGRVNFLTIYTIEAHPQGSKSPYREGEWLTAFNRFTGVRLLQPQTLPERLDRASFSIRELGTRNPVVVDVMNNSAWNIYGAAPSPAFVVDKTGRVALRQVWVEPKGIKHALDLLLSNVD